MSLFFSVAIDLILFQLADKKEMHNILDEFQFWPAFDHPKKVSKSRYNGENNGVSVFHGCFTYLRTSQNILMICWLPGEQ